MPVDPSFQPLLDVIASMAVDRALTVDEVRAGGVLLDALDDDPEDVAEVIDLTIPAPGGPIPARRYTPVDRDRDDRDDRQGRAVLLWFHGGGWMMGDLAGADGTCRRLANRSQAIVVSVDYRLAPEHPYPAGLEDCLAAHRWAVAHAASFGGDPARLAVGGDSAGGNLAALVALANRDRAEPRLRHQLLVYPVTDLTMSFPSMDENAEGCLLTRAHMALFIDHYLGADRGLGDPKDPHVSPQHVDDVAGVASATVITAEFDPLRDEGEAYAGRLATAGVDAIVRRFDGAIHAFFAMTSVTPMATEAVDFAAARLRDALA